ncbi:hypothetical protein Tco_0950491 [Tanacetum coccineum]
MAGRLLLGDNMECKIRGIGKVRVQLKDGSSFVLHNVRYTPELKRNVISLRTLEKEGYIIKLQSGKIKVINGSRVVLSVTRRDNCVYSLDGHVVADELNASVEEKDNLAHVLHKRLGDIYIEAGRLQEGMGLYSQVQTRSIWKVQRVEAVSRELDWEDVAGTPQRNGLAERINRTLMDKGTDKSIVELQVRGGTLQRIK